MERSGILNIFFDIDGTLLPVGKPVPADAVCALNKVKSLGHRLFFCTGRSPVELTDELLGLPFDGGVFSAGANIRLGDRTISRKSMTEDQKNLFFRVVEKYDLLWLIQSDEGTFITPQAFSLYSGLTRKIHSRDIEFKGFIQVDDFPEDKPVYKMLILSEKGYVLEARKELEGILHSVNNTTGLPQECAAELMASGVSKASGIEELVRYLGDDMGSTVGIGDGENDIEMIDFCATGIAMGNACDLLKKHADYITADIEDGGIAKALDFVIRE